MTSVALPDLVSAVLADAVTARVTPGGVIETGTSAGPVCTVAAGHLTYAADAATVVADTIYDLASLTKVLATTTLALRAHAAGMLPLETRLSARLPGFADRPDVTVQDLLEHAAGFPAHRPYFRAVAGRAGYLARIAAEPAAYAARTTHIYTDLGFILLGLMLEDAAGVGLDAQFTHLVRDVAHGADLAYGVQPSWHARVAPSGVDPWRGVMVAGHVHDSNAAALAGVAGHAGLFGTAGAVGAFARWWMARVSGRGGDAGGIPGGLATRAVSRGDVPASSRGLGWDTMLPTSSCGTRMSARAFGHTGFTGTSLWIDPARDLYLVCLTNRVHAADDADGIRRLRVRLHDTVVDAWDATARR
ncbi:MAG: serine hydrolase [Acidobacteria bacterium]|nr:serine hydrolase [Acidobacteriota bacterium]